MLSHHMVIRDGKIANYHPYPPTPWNANPRDSYGTPGPYEDAVQGQPIFEENDREHFKGIDIMRTVRSFDPCLPCGVHMYLGEGKSARPAALAHPVGHRGIDDAPVGIATPGRSDADARWRTAGDRIETLLDASAAGGAIARERAEQLVREVTDLYGAGLDRMMTLRGAARCRTWPTTSSATTWWPACCWCTACTRTTVERRIADALDTVRPYLGSHGGDVAPARRRRRRWSACSSAGSCKSCPSSAVTLELAVEDAVRAAAPEIASIEVVAPRTNRRRPSSRRSRC